MMRELYFASMPPRERLQAVIGIVQMRILADDTPLIPEKLFGVYRAPSAPLELAEKLLVSLIPYIGDPDEE